MEETTREDIGYKHYTKEEKAEAIKKLSQSLKMQSKFHRQIARIKLHSDGNIYRYRPDIAMELVKNGKAELIEVLT